MKNLGLREEAEQLMAEDNHAQALKVMNQIIDDHKAGNPIYTYLRAKCHFNLGAEHLNEARRDIFSTLKYVSAKYSKPAIVLRIKAEYTAAIIETTYGCGKLHFPIILNFSQIVISFSPFVA